MNYVDGIKIGGTTSAQIPCIKGNGSPTTETEGAVGCLYMDTDTGDMYKCIAVKDGVYTWLATANGYYSTTREEIGVSPENIDTDYIYGLYNELMAKYPDNVQKNTIYNNDRTFSNYEYVISTGEYNAEGKLFDQQMDTHIKKPKYLLLSGIHGYERQSIVAVYRFIRDVLNGHNIPSHFRDGCVIHVIPVGTPYSLDNCIRHNENRVDINRNFDWRWGEDISDPEGMYPGTSPASEKETQAIANWLAANQDAEVFLDCHVRGTVNEVVMLVGSTDNVEDYDWAKKIALRGLDRIIPFWRDVIRYREGTVFSQSISDKQGGFAFGYARGVLNIPSLGFELSPLQNGTQDDFVNNKFAITPETIAAGAEAIGNVLIEFYEQSLSEVVDMTETNGKIDMLTELVNKSLSFRVETGVYTVEEDLSGSQTIKIPCTNGAKICAVLADDNTLSAITSTKDTPLFVGCFGQTVVKLPVTTKEALQYRSYMVMMKPNTQNIYIPMDHATTVSNTDGFSIPCIGLKAGKYNWTAYYWND